LQRSAYRTQATYDILILKTACGGIFMLEITRISILLRAVMRKTQTVSPVLTGCLLASFKHALCDEGRTDKHERTQ
jgi:hypothetical protein